MVLTKPKSQSRTEKKTMHTVLILSGTPTKVITKGILWSNYPHKYIYQPNHPKKCNSRMLQIYSCRVESPMFIKVIEIINEFASRSYRPPLTRHTAASHDGGESTRAQSNAWLIAVVALSSCLAPTILPPAYASDTSPARWTTMCSKL